MLGMVLQVIPYEWTENIHSPSISMRTVGYEGYLRGIFAGWGYAHMLHHPVKPGGGGRLPRRLSSHSWLRTIVASKPSAIREMPMPSPSAQRTYTIGPMPRGLDGGFIFAGERMANHLLRHGGR